MSEEVGAARGRQLTTRPGRRCQRPNRVGVAEVRVEGQDGQCDRRDPVVEVPLDLLPGWLHKLLREMRRAGVTHNDIAKPQNWLMTPEGRAAVIDFQLASVHESAGRREPAVREYIRVLAVEANRADAWPPYELDITPLVRDGDNRIAVELVATLRNLLGPHHRGQFTQQRTTFRQRRGGPGGRGRWRRPCWSPGRRRRPCSGPSVPWRSGPGSLR